MACFDCILTDLQYEILIQDETNIAMIPDIERHLKRNQIEVTSKQNRLVMPEIGVMDFLDYCLDHMETDFIQFRLGKTHWRPLPELKEVYETQWIDEVIQKELLTCFFQPIVNREEETVAYEILSRFINEDGTIIYPALIFEAAKKRGRLFALDKLCRMTAVRYTEFLQGKKAFINFIPTSIYSPEHCLRSTSNLANAMGIPSSQFVFEVVETEQVEDMEHLKRILAYYKEKGFQYALDDVGEGFNTLEILEDLAPHYMKLDMKYVQGVSSDKNKQHVATQFLQKAFEIGSIPLAEGVEAKEDFEWLHHAGYQLFQGYLFGKPRPIIS